MIVFGFFESNPPVPYAPAPFTQPRKEMGHLPSLHGFGSPSADKNPGTHHNVRRLGEIATTYDTS